MASPHALHVPEPCSPTLPSPVRSLSLKFFCSALVPLLLLLLLRPEPVQVVGGWGGGADGGGEAAELVSSEVTSPPSQAVCFPEKQWDPANSCPAVFALALAPPPQRLLQRGK